MKNIEIVLWFDDGATEALKKDPIKMFEKRVFTTLKAMIKNWPDSFEKQTQVPINIFGGFKDENEAYYNTMLFRKALNK